MGHYRVITGSIELFPTDRSDSAAGRNTGTGLCSHPQQTNGIESGNKTLPAHNFTRSHGLTGSWC
jgi:hypothetical protein